MIFGCLLCFQCLEGVFPWFPGSFHPRRKMVSCVLPEKDRERTESSLHHFQPFWYLSKEDRRADCCCPSTERCGDEHVSMLDGPKKTLTMRSQKKSPKLKRTNPQRQDGYCITDQIMILKLRKPLPVFMWHLLLGYSIVYLSEMCRSPSLQEACFIMLKLHLQK